MYSLQYPSGFDNAPNQIIAGKEQEKMAMDLPPEVQQAVARYLQGLNTPTPISSSERIDITVPPAQNKASSYTTNTVDTYLQQQDAFAHSVSIKDTPIANGKGIQMSRSYSLPTTAAMELPMSSPTPQQYLGGDFENSVYLLHYS